MTYELLARRITGRPYPAYIIEPVYPVKFWDIKPQPQTALEEHIQWKDRLTAQLVLHMGRKIEVK